MRTTSPVGLPATLLALLLSIAGVNADPDASWSGGARDGHDADSGGRSLGYPQVNNAVGCTNATPTHAWLTGTLLSTGGAAARVYAFWGEQDGGTNKNRWTSSTNLGERVEWLPISVRVPVSSNTAYRYRFYATNDAGQEAWETTAESFLTPSMPVVSSRTADPIDYTTAALRGILHAGSGAGVLVFWGQNTNRWANTNDLGGLSLGAFRVGVSGLTAGQPYYYQCRATNSYGTNTSAVSGFMTPVPFDGFAGGSLDGYDMAQENLMLRPGVFGTLFLMQ